MKKNTCDVLEKERSSSVWNVSMVNALNVGFRNMNSLRFEESSDLSVPFVVVPTNNVSSQIFAENKSFGLKIVIGPAFQRTDYPAFVEAVENAHNRMIDSHPNIPEKEKQQYKIEAKKEVAAFWQFFSDKGNEVKFSNEKVQKFHESCLQSFEEIADLFSLEGESSYQPSLFANLSWVKYIETLKEADAEGLTDMRKNVLNKALENLQNSLDNYSRLPILQHAEAEFWRNSDVKEKYRKYFLSAYYNNLVPEELLRDDERNGIQLNPSQIVMIPNGNDSQLGALQGAKGKKNNQVRWRDNSNSYDDAPKNKNTFSVFTDVDYLSEDTEWLHGELLRLMNIWKKAKESDLRTQERVIMEIVTGINALIYSERIWEYEKKSFSVNHILKNKVNCVAIAQIQKQILERFFGIEVWGGASHKHFFAMIPLPSGEAISLDGTGVSDRPIGTPIIINPKQTPYPIYSYGNFSNLIQASVFTWEAGNTDIDTAIVLYREVMRLDGNNPSSLYNLAISLEKKGGSDNLKEAESLYRKSIALNASGPKYTHSLANLLYRTGSRKNLKLVNKLHDKAEELYRKKIYAYSRDPDYRYGLANLLVTKGGKNNIEEAESLYRLAIDLDDDEPDYKIALAILLERQGDEMSLIEAHDLRLSATILPQLRRTLDMIENL